ncbi:MAG: peptide deformylase [Candidatus Saccharibacteria bacterium]
MKKENIITLPNSTLRKKSDKVGFVTPEIKKLVDDMVSVAIDWEDSRPHEISAALAAVQINCPEKVIIVRDEFEDKSIRDFTALINPKIVKFEGKIELDYEGCLSVPGIYGLVPRYEKVRVKAMDVNGNEIKFKATGFLARIIQHETDHTNGIVFIDHIRDKKDAFFELDEKGDLQPLDYEENIKNNNILW